MPIIQDNGSETFTCIRKTWKSCENTDSSRISDTGSLQWGPKMCMSNK